MYMIVEYETQNVWAMDGETGETKAVQGETKDEIDKKYGYQIWKHKHEKGNYGKIILIKNESNPMD